MAVACLALLVALGGVSYAAAVLPANSVGPKQLRKGAVTASKLRKAAVTPSKIAPKTITLFKGEKGAPGAKGQPGPQGPKGDPGPVDTSALSRFGHAKTYAALDFGSYKSSTNSNNSGTARTTTTPDAAFTMPLDLPQGAQVTRVTGYFSDNNPTQNITFFLVRQEPSAGDAEAIGQVSSNGASGAVRSASFTPSNVVIDNESAAYSVTGQFPGFDPSNIGFYGMKVEYTL